MLSIDEVDNLINEGLPIVFKDYKLPREVEDYLVTVLVRYLEFLGKERIGDQLSYCLREVMINAKKANTKRVYFKEEKLNINSGEDYSKGMKEFKNKTLANIDYYLDLQEKEKLYIQVEYELSEQFFNITVSNNSPLIKSEAETITQKVMKAKSFNSLDEAFQSVLDDSEGAGLGLVILILMIRKIGIGTKHFTIFVKDGVTNVKIAVPLSLATEEEIDMISQSMIHEIDTVPMFPERIIKLTELLRNSETDYKQIAKTIMQDASLSFEVLRMANSAHYKTVNKIERLDLAVNILGSKGLFYLLQSYGAVNSLSQKYSYKDIKDILEHSVEIANIASILCNRYNMNKDGDFAYIGGLLHDIGKILLKSLHPKTIEKATKICVEKNISIRVIEDMLSGANHAKVGSLVAKRWNIPDKIVEIISYHEDIFRAPDELKGIVSIIMLSHILYDAIRDLPPVVEPEEKNYIFKKFRLNEEGVLARLVEYTKAELTKRTI